MNSQKIKPDRPSQFYDQIEAALKAHFGDELDIEGYESITPEIERSTFLIEFESSKGGARNNAGQYCHCFQITIHCLISNAHKRAALAALNVASDVERLVEFNRFGIDSLQIDPPEDVISEPSMFSMGKGGFEGRAVTWRQNLYLGDEPAQEEVRGGIRWAINPVDKNDPNEYKSL
jgi:hypothetical protein